MEKGKRGYGSSQVLLLPYPATGHINPLLQFAGRLVCKGLKPTIAITHFFAKSMQAETGSVAIDFISDGFDEGGYESAESAKVYHDRFATVGSRTLAELIEKQRSSGCPFSCLIYDPFLPWGLEVAEQLGLAGAAFFTQSCTVDIIYYHEYEGQITVPLEDEMVSLPGMSLQFGAPELPSFVSAPGSYPSFRELLLSQFSNLGKADWLFVNTFEKLEDKVVRWMEKHWPLKTIGPSVPSMYLDNRVEGDNAYGLNYWKPNTDACMKWLDEKPIASVVYVSYGSFATLPPEQLEEVAQGLRVSNKNFLWAVRATEQCKLPSKFIEMTQAKGLVVNWSPQLQVLAHQAVGCFVTHCGWNSTLEALSLGVPMVALPQWTDQPTNAKCMEELWGVGVRAKRDEEGIVRREELELRIKEVMEGERAEEIKKNASKWRELAKEAVDEGGSSDKNIDEFVTLFSR